MNNELKHHGVLGMRWGVRRKNQSNELNSSSSKKSVKKMSNEELKSKIERNNLERDYRKSVKDSRSRGHNFVLDVLEQIGKNSLTNIGTQAVNSTLTYAGNKGIEKIVKKYNKSANKDEIDALTKQLQFYTNNKKKDK